MGGKNDDIALSAAGAIFTGYRRAIGGKTPGSARRR